MSGRVLDHTLDGARGGGLGSPPLLVSVSQIGLTLASTCTIYDVASTADVSVATVSRHLQGLRVHKAERIAEVIRELGFRPRPAARSLKSGSTGMIAVVVPDITNPYFAAVVKGIESITRQGDYHISLYNSEEDDEREAAILSALYGRVDGVILTPADESEAAKERLSETGMPIVLLDREIGDGTSFDSVLIDNVAGARQAATYLLGLDHTKIGVISGPLDTTPGRTRHGGFLSVLEEAGLESDPAHIRISDFREEGGYQSALRLLALEKPPTAIFVANNLMSVGVLRALHDMHVQVPRDLSVVGFDDLRLAELLNPPLTVIGRPMEEQGALAVRLLLNRLGGQSSKPRRVVLDTWMTIRESCARPRPTRPTKNSTKTGSVAHV